MLDRPYEFVQQERVCITRTEDPSEFRHLTIIMIQARGTARPSFTSKLLDDYEREGVLDPTREENIKAVAGVLYGG